MLGKRTLRQEEAEDFIIEVLVLEILGRTPILGEEVLNSLKKAIQKIHSLGYTNVPLDQESLCHRLYSASKRMIQRGWMRCREVEFTADKIPVCSFTITPRGVEYRGYAKDSFHEVLVGQNGDMS